LGHRKSEQPTDSQILILKSLKAGGDLKEITNLAGIPPGTVGMEIAKLQIRGYITDDCRLTHRGERALAF
jgi:DNA-binding MarR family transcriptional regulator